MLINSILWNKDRFVLRCDSRWHDTTQVFYLQWHYPREQESGGACKSAWGQADKVTNTEALTSHQWTPLVKNQGFAPSDRTGKLSVLFTVCLCLIINIERIYQLSFQRGNNSMRKQHQRDRQGERGEWNPVGIVTLIPLQTPDFEPAAFEGCNFLSFGAAKLIILWIPLPVSVIKWSTLIFIKKTVEWETLNKLLSDSLHLTLAASSFQSD